MATPSAKVAVLGAGSWGTALAALASAKAATILWARDPEQAAAINATRQNKRYLPNIQLPSALQCTSQLDVALEHVLGSEPGLIILGVPVAGMADICTQLQKHLAHKNTELPALVWTCKGFHAEKGLLPHQIVEQHTKQLNTLSTGVLSGPSFAHEVAQGLPVALTIASDYRVAIDKVRQALHGQTARIYSSSDIIGVETAGALKNIMAIACGISDALGLGANARAALITRALAEMRRLGTALGGHEHTFSGLAGLGDLVLTATGDLSRNRQVGLAIGRGEPLTTILSASTTAEGVRCARAVLELGQSYEVELPITQAVNDVLFNGVTPSQAVKALLARQARAE